ncbi:MAG: UDP-N-acetylmuramoyl-L-alanine--D-glutamate ligase [Rikenellaceae bacterium]|nr:UDP-N-acetylmuramoyl-L-alanine--D-glutamate ligase [Rikenellaceae bacterium]
MSHKRIVVLGGGESGFGSAVLAKVKGFDVFLSDAGAIKEEYKNKLDEWKIPFEENGHTFEKILNAEEIIKSPGIPEKVSIIQSAVQNNIPVISEIEFAGRFTNAKTIGITGSNGKTTTTTLIHNILSKANSNVGLAGNIGSSYAYQVATEDKEWYVIELSSFQLDGMFDFKVDIAVLMNITPDHLDRYDYNINNYIDSKFRILRNQTSSDFFIYCIDDRFTHDNMNRFDPQSKMLPFSVRTENNTAAYLSGNNIISEFNGKRINISRNNIRIDGIHNIYNIMASALAASAAGVPENVIIETIEAFSGVEHRMEKVRERKGVLYINDSKATNVDSVWYALDGMEKPIVWIAGGTDKGNDYSVLKDLAKTKVKALICLGIDNQKLIDSFQDYVDKIISTDNIEDAVKNAASIAENGDVVLLSPACASFDLFKNYEDRGKKFKEQVNKL